VERGHFWARLGTFWARGGHAVAIRVARSARRRKNRLVTNRGNGDSKAGQPARKVAKERNEDMQTEPKILKNSNPSSYTVQAALDSSFQDVVAYLKNAWDETSRVLPFELNESEWLKFRFCRTEGHAALFDCVVAIAVQKTGKGAIETQQITNGDIVFDLQVARIANEETRLRAVCMDLQGMVAGVLLFSDLSKDWPELEQQVPALYGRCKTLVAKSPDLLAALDQAEPKKAGAAKRTRGKTPSMVHLKKEAIEFYDNRPTPMTVEQCYDKFRHEKNLPPERLTHGQFKNWINGK